MLKKVKCLMTKAEGLLRMGGINFACRIIIKRLVNKAYQGDIYNLLSRAKKEEYAKMVEGLYLYHTGRKFNIKSPQTFNEKIQWIKIYDSTEIKSRLTDKYFVREWVKEKIGESYLIPLLGVWNNFKEINFADLPQSFVLKANHGSGMNIIVKDKSRMDLGGVENRFSLWMSQNFAYIGLELQYLNIERKIIAEEFIENRSGNLYDYKIFCFNGIPQFIQIIGDREHQKHTAKEAFYDTKWEKQDFTSDIYPQYEEPINRPKKLPEMLSIASKLSQGFAHVRVDLYELDNGDIKFGEMTFTPASGFVQWKPYSTDKKLGKLLKLPYEIDNIEGT